LLAVCKYSICILQEINYWRWEQPGNGAKIVQGGKPKEHAGHTPPIRNITCEGGVKYLIIGCNYEKIAFNVAGATYLQLL